MMRARARVTGTMAAAVALAVPLLGVTPAAAAPPTAADGVIAYGSGGEITMQQADGSGADEVTTYDFPAEHLQSLALSHDGETLVYSIGFDTDTGWSGSGFRVVDVETGSVVREVLESGSGTWANLVDVSPDGSQVVYATEGPTQLLDVATGTTTALPGLAAADEMRATAFTLDGASLVAQAVGEGRPILTYDLATAAMEPVAFTPPESSAFALDVANDGSLLYQSSGGCQTVATTRAVQLDGSGDELIGTNRDTQVVVSPDGEHMLSQRHQEPYVLPCAGDSLESPVAVTLADRDGANAQAAFTAQAWDWAGGSEAPEPTRVAGSSRYATAVALSEESFEPGVPVVYLASGQSFPDALAAGPAAAHEGGPVLLTPKGQLPEVVLAEIERLEPGRVVIVGGTASVSATVETALETQFGAETVERISGANRFATSAAIAEDAFGSATGAYVVSGMNFPDALSAGAAAGAAGQPMLLVNGAGAEVPAAVEASLDTLGVTEVTVVGGTASVSEAVRADLASIAGEATRVSGVNRFATAVAVNQAFDAAGHVFVASGMDFPDALAASAVAAAQGEPLYLTQASCLPQVTLDDLERLGWPDVTIVGGTASVSAAVESYTTC